VAARALLELVGHQARGIESEQREKAKRYECSDHPLIQTSPANMQWHSVCGLLIAKTSSRVQGKMFAETGGHSLIAYGLHGRSPS
jgi:hypothetical protein